MNEGISVDEACRIRALTPEDFARLCTADGAVKQQTRTESVANPAPTESAATPQGIFILAGLVGLVIVLGLITLLRHRWHRSPK